MFVSSKSLRLAPQLVAVLFVWLMIWLAGCNTLAGDPLPTLAPTRGMSVAVNNTATSEPPTATPTLTPSTTPSPGPSPTRDAAATTTRVPTQTPMPTATPTSLPQPEPVLTITAPEELLEGIPTPSTAVPTAVPTFEVPENTTNILLLGSDTALGSDDTRTDTMIIVSINEDGPTASMISLPRDLFVYIPGWTMNRINTAAAQIGRAHV